MITAETLKKLLELEAAATPGPWDKGCASHHVLGKAIGDYGKEYEDIIEEIHACGPGHSLETDVKAYSKVLADASFIAEARNVIKELVEEVIKSREALKVTLEALEFYSDQPGTKFGGFIAREALKKASEVLCPKSTDEVLK